MRPFGLSLDKGKQSFDKTGAAPLLVAADVSSSLLLISFSDCFYLSPLCLLKGM
jgi:hypothetical protein